MKRRLLLGAVSAIAMIGAAQAADLGGMKEAEVAPPIWNWSGFYAGVNGGYIWGSGVFGNDNEWFNGYTPNSYTAFGQNSSEGGFGGGQIGFNIQRDRLVYGIEADIQGAGLDASRDVSPYDSPATKNGYFSDARVEEQLDWFGSVRGRVGLVPWQNILVYVTGGVAFGGVQDSLKQTNYQSYNYNPSGTQICTSANNNDVHAGYDLGAGVEYGLTPAWSVKFEYQFMDLGDQKVFANYAEKGGYSTVSSVAESKLSFNTVRVGINYHFIPEYVPLK
ncbi:MAG: outer membrane beta-barrel protein [Rhodomicrobium sp.]